MSDAPMRVEGVDDFVRGIRELERVAPIEVNDELAEVAERTILPVAEKYTPVGDGRSGTPGRLKAGTKIVKVRGVPAFVNKQPYANTQHWGRKTRGAVTGARFVPRAVKDTIGEVTREIEERLSRLLERHLR
jgi:hypothetical protein